MIKLERTSVTNFDNAMRGARNPMNSWGRYDSYYDEDGNFVFGPNDLSLAKRLCKAGTDHRKFIRMIFVTVDVTAPMYWWKEYVTFKVGTVANSTSIAGMMTLEREEVILDDGLFELLLVPHPQNAAELQNLIWALLNQQYNSGGLIFRHVSALHVETDEDLPWSLDGEYEPSQPTVDITNCQRALTMLL